MLPPGGVELRSEQSFAAPTWWRVIAYLAVTFAPATKSYKGTREKLETKDHSRGAPELRRAGATPAILAGRQKGPLGHGAAGAYLGLAAIRRGVQRPRPDCRPLGSAPQRSTRPRPL